MAKGANGGRGKNKKKTSLVNLEDGTLLDSVDGCDGSQATCCEKVMLAVKKVIVPWLWKKCCSLVDHVVTIMIAHEVRDRIVAYWRTQHNV